MESSEPVKLDGSQLLRQLDHDRNMIGFSVSQIWNQPPERKLDIRCGSGFYLHLKPRNRREQWRDWEHFVFREPVISIR